MRRTLVSLLVAMGVIVIIALPAQANLYTFDFTGTILGVQSPLSGTFSAGQSISGSFTYDSATSPSINLPDSATYDGAIKALTFNFGTYAGSLGTPVLNYILVENDVNTSPGTYHDAFDVFALGGGLVGNDVNGLTLDSFALGLVQWPPLNTIPDALSSTALPTSLDLSKFTDPDVNLSFRTLSGDELSSVVGSITSLTPGINPVPEPATLLLLGSGLAGLVGYGRRRMRK